MVCVCVSVCVHVRVCVWRGEGHIPPHIPGTKTEKTHATVNRAAVRLDETGTGLDRMQCQVRGRERQRERQRERERERKRERQREREIGRAHV